MWARASTPLSILGLLRMRKQTTKEIGDLLENYILQAVKRFDPKARLSRGSGCGNDIADIQSSYLFIEAKKRTNVRNMPIDMDVWQHLLNQMPIKTDKIPVLVTENSEGIKMAHLDFDTFMGLMGKVVKGC